jgi:prophage maintenance system killer protein
MPIESQIKEEIADVLEIEEPTERAITHMLSLMRKQMFLDGNKRTSMLAANQIMIANGCGIISIPIEHQPEFTRMLVGFYESGNMEEIKTFVYENGIDGIDFRQNESRAEEEKFSPIMTM